MNLPWTVALAVDGSEGSTSESGVGIAEARGIGKVKELAAQLESHILLELEAFEDGEVQIMDTVSAYNPGIAWGSAVMLGQWFCEGSRIETNPFPDAPPHYIRARLYRYQFAPIGDKAWWNRERIGEWLPALDVNDPQFWRLLDAMDWLD